MKSFLFVLFFTVLCLSTFAQTNFRSNEVNDKQNAPAKRKRQDSIDITKETINIRGIIYGSDGKPASNVIIGLLNNEFHPEGYATTARSDSTGYFELKGAKPRDTLTIIDGRYSYFPFDNRGSRFIVIYMPPPKIIDVTPDPIEIKALRKSIKSIPVFRTKANTDKVFDSSAIASLVYPEFKGGSEKFISYIRQNLVYPKKAVSNDVEGTVEVLFTIEKDGAVSEVRVIKGIGYGCDEQVVELIKTSAKWRPGIFCGIPFTMQETVSVKFSLTDK